MLEKYDEDQFQNLAIFYCYPRFELIRDLSICTTYNVHLLFIVVTKIKKYSKVSVTQISIPHFLWQFLATTLDQQKADAGWFINRPYLKISIIFQ